MAVRLKLKVDVKGKIMEKVALLNSGYEAPSPQLLIPVDFAKELDLWPPEGALDVEFDTAGGLLKAWLYSKAGKASVVANDEGSREVEIDIVISPIADEPLISDALAEELEIAVESFGKGLWRFRWEPIDRVKQSAKA